MSEITKQFILESTGRELNDEQYTKFMDIYNTRKRGGLGDLGQQMKAGALRTTASGRMMVGDYAGAASDIKASTEAASQDPDLQRRIEAIPDADSVINTLINLGMDPKAALALVAQSLPGSLASAAVALPAGRVAKGVAEVAAKPVAASVFGGGSALQEYGSAAFQLMAEAGVDITNPDEIQATLEDPDIGPAIKGYAAKKGIPIGVFDAISFGIAGKLLPAGKATVGGLAAEAGVQAGLGGAGEAAGQIVADGGITDKGAIGLEIGLEGITGAPQAVLQPAAEKAIGIAEGKLLPSVDPMTNFVESIRKGKKDGESDVSIEEAPIEKDSKVAKAKQGIENWINELKIAAETGKIISDGKEVPVDSPAGQATVKAITSSIEKMKEVLAKREAKTEPDVDSGLKDRVAAEAKREELPVKAPKEILRGTPKQMRTRLMALSKDELAARATEYAGVDATGLKKPEIVDKILNHYQIDTANEAVQTPSAPAAPVVVEAKPEAPKVEPNTIPPELASVDADTRKELFNVAQGKDPVASKAADKWLQQLPDNKALNAGLKGATRIRNYNPRGAVLESVRNGANKYNKAKGGKRPDTAKRAVNEVLNTLKKSGFFTSVENKVFEAPTAELVEYADKKYNFGDKEVTKQFLAKGKVRENVIADYVSDKLEGKETVTTSPLLDNIAKRLQPVFAAQEQQSTTPKEKAILEKDVKAAEQTPAEEVEQNTVDNSDIATYEAVNAIREVSDRISEELFQKTNYEKGIDDLASKNPDVGAIQSLLNKYDVFRSMASMARKYPILNPLYQLYKDRDAFRHNIATAHLMNAKLLTQKYGTPRTDKALEILDAMSRPNQAGGSQVIKLGEDGRLKYQDFDGKYKFADGQTSQAVKDWMDLFKSDVAQKMQAVITELQDYGIDPQTASRTDIVNVLRQLRGLGNDNAALTIEKNIEVLDRLENVYRSNKAYYPHSRNRGGEGKYAFATYTKNAEGKYELAGLYPVKKDKFGRVDRDDEAAVRKRIAEDEKQYNVQFYTSKGNAMGTSTPFALTSSALRNSIMRNAKDPNLAYEALSSLLSHKGIDPKEINAVFDDLQLRNNMEKLFTNMRERGGYYGYDNEDRLSSVVDNLVHQSGVLTSFKYTPKINAYVAAASTQMGEQGPRAEKPITMLKKYADYMTDPREEWAALRAANFWYFLAGNPSTAMLQLMSTYQNTLPWLAQYVSPIEFAKANVMSVTNLTRGRAWKFVPNQNLLTKETLPQFMRQTGIDAETSKLLLNLKNGGLLDPQYGIEAIGDLGIDATGRVQNRRTRGQQALGALKDFPSKLIQVPEVIARVNSALLIADSIKNTGNFEKIGNLLYRTDPSFKNTVDIKYDGRITKEAILRHALEENHAVFGKTARADFMRSGPSALLFPFLTYPIQIMEQYARLLSQRGAEGKRAAAMMVLFYPIMFGGLMAVPGYDTWDWMLKWFTQLAQQRNTTAEIEMSKAMTDLGMSPTLSRKLLSGPIFDAANIDASARIGNQFFFQPILDSLLDPSEGPMGAQTNADFLGGASALLTGARNATARIKEGDDPIRAIGSQMSPIVLRNLFKAEDILQGDVASTKGDRLLPTPEENPDVWGSFGSKDEALLQAVGLRPAVISEASKRRFQQTLLDKGAQSAMTNHYANLARQTVNMHKAKAKGDKEAFAEARKAYMTELKDAIDTNKNSDSPKSPKDLAKAIKSSLKGRVDQELNPLKTQKHLGKGRDAKKDMKTLSLPRMEQYVTDR